MEQVRTGQIWGRRWARAAWVALGLLAGCGGGGSDGGLLPLPGVTCSTIDERVWLDAYFDDWYFWYRDAPNPSPLADRTLDEFFQASLYTGTDSRFPRDRWSNMQPSSDFDRFFSEGRQLGYGVSVSGVEAVANPSRPLRVRYVEPLSDAAAQDVRRGDEVLALNGRPAADLVAANDFGALTATAEGQTLVATLRRAGVQRQVTLHASAFTLSPVTLGGTVTTPQGRRMGYLHVKDMIDQARTPLDTTFDNLRSAGVQDLVIDLRYNGGGLVAVAQRLASYVAAARTDGRVFASLRYNDRKAASQDEDVRFERPSAALNLQRVYVLTGPRTCSASELVVNGLKPFVTVVTVGATSCGKPVGFRPVSRCDTTFSVVNFESVNADRQGRYFDGLAATCAVDDDFSTPLGNPDEPLLAAARQHADSGRCTAAAAAPSRMQAQGLRWGDGRGAVHDGDERPGMWVR